MKKRMPIKLNEHAMLTKAQQRARYTDTCENRNGKPLFVFQAGEILKEKSAFETKKLCGGPTFSLGMACPATCTYCYVQTQLGRHAAIQRIIKETNLSFDQIVVEKTDPLPQLRTELLNRKGQRRFPDENDHRVVFASPLVDVAANKTIALETVAACRIILENSSWHIRLLSKFATLKLIAENLSDYKKRMIYGFSTGTFDDRLARSLEHGSSSPSARIEALHWLQDNQFRTFGMICPSLPQADYDTFAREAAERLRFEKCEEVWAEIFNIRGASLTKSVEGLLAGGFVQEAERLKTVSGKIKKNPAWEEYARQTFLAHATVVPPGKLRFLQYVREGQLTWWRAHQKNGAVLLGNIAHPKKKRPVAVA